MISFFIIIHNKFSNFLQFMILNLLKHMQFQSRESTLSVIYFSFLSGNKVKNN